MQLRELMRGRLVTIGSTDAANSAGSKMRKHRIRRVVVTQSGSLSGVISEPDLRGRSGGETRVGRTVGDLKSPRVASSEPWSTLREAAGIGRARPRKADSARRSPFVGLLPKAAKRGSATELRQVPVHIRSVGDELGPDDQLYIRRKLGTRLGKFASSIERVSVRTQDVNGPRGGIDRVCRIKVAMSGLPSVVFESRDATVNAAVDEALVGVERAVRRAVQRRRMKPLRRVARTSLPE